MNMNNDEIRKETFGKFENEEDFEYEKSFTDVGEKRNSNARNKKNKKSEKTNTKGDKKAEKSTKPSVIDKLKSAFVKEKKTDIPESWTGQTTVVDILAPSSVDNGSRDYIVVDGVYHTYLYVAGYGYRTKNEGAWLSPLVEAGDNIGISFSFKKMPRDKILSRIIGVIENARVFRFQISQNTITDIIKVPVRIKGHIALTIC